MKCKYCGKEMYDLSEKFAHVHDNKRVWLCFNFGGSGCPAYDRKTKVQAHLFDGKWYTGQEWEDYINS